jgi:hypothetical protein
VSVLVAAEKHPITTIALFFTALVGLVLLMGWNVWVAFTVALAIGTVLGVMYVVDVSAPYRTLDCRDEHHVACAECWCECHTAEEVAA